MKPSNRPPGSPNFQAMALWRAPLLVGAILSLLGAIWAGWIRLGWNWPPLQPVMVGLHGPLMISGFFGTLIAVERAVALRARWAYIGPALTLAGGLLILAGIRSALPVALMTAGSFGLVVVFIAILRRHLAPYTLVMSAGALAWAVGNSFWLAGWPVYRVALWWAAFLILTIAGERLELGRLARMSRRVENLFLGAVGLYLLGVALAVFAPAAGARLSGVGLLALTAWLVRYDIARRTIRQTGLPRFAAASLLSGYAWLIAAALLSIVYGQLAAGFLYDAFLHAIFLGFVFAMIFAHAPIIFPAILGLPIKFERSAYIPLALLHLSLLMRFAGDLLSLPALRLWGGLFNGVTILIFLALTARGLLRGAAMKNLRRCT